MQEKGASVLKRKQGRPLGSPVRVHIREILSRYGPLYGYQIYQHYIESYPKITLRLIYYHLRKGVETKEFVIVKIATSEETRSWGGTTQHIIYGIPL